MMHIDMRDASFLASISACLSKLWEIFVKQKVSPFSLPAKIMAHLLLFCITFCNALQVATCFSRLPHSSTLSRNKVQLSSLVLRDTAVSKVSSGGISGLFDVANKLTSSTFYSGIETVIVLGLLSAIDGGFSGDWSRLGLITTDVEATLHSAVTSVGLFHLVCAPIAAISASKKNQPVVPAVMHTLLIGGLGLFKVFLQKEGGVIDFPNVKQGFADAVAGKYDVAAVSQAIEDVIDENAVVMFSFTTCPFCIKSKQLLIDELGVNVKVVELDVDRKVGFPIRAELGKLTGRVTVPSIWIRGQFVGGCNDGPTSVTLPAVKAVSKGFNLFGFGDKNEAVAASDARTIKTKGGVISLNSEGSLLGLLASAKAL